MPRKITQYRVFIGSPGGLAKERKCFYEKLTRFSSIHAERRQVIFQPVGWEDTLPGAGRPQALINRDLKECDYATFVFHDRWGSPSSETYTCGTQEEIAIAEEMYRSNTIKEISFYFKKIDERRIGDPGAQMQALLDFKSRLEKERRYLFKQYTNIGDFSCVIEAQLASWLDKHDSTEKGRFKGDFILDASKPFERNLAHQITAAYWTDEALSNLNRKPADLEGAHFCAKRAVSAAESDIDWAKAKNTLGIALIRLNRTGESIPLFAEIADRFPVP